MSDPGSRGLVRPTLRGRDVLAITVGIVVGAGIFRSPSLVAGVAGSEAAVLIAWAAGGLLSIVGALCYAELASAYPSVGGDLHFLERAYGGRFAFLYGWARVTVIQTGSIALLAYVFGDYMASLLPVGSFSSAVYAGAAVVALTLANWVGVRLGTSVQMWLTIVELLGLVALIAAGLVLEPASGSPSEVSASASTSWGLMMVFVLLTYGGWNEAVYLSAELKDSKRRIGMLMIAALAIVTILYVLANWAMLRALGLGGVAGSSAVAADLVSRAAGPEGAAFISLVVAIAALTSANATAITGARSSCALGRSFVRLRWLGRWDERRCTPTNALLAQGLIALLLVAAGAFARSGFELAVQYTAPVFWFFFLMAGLSLFVLRVREPARERPFKVPFYPLLPALFCATSVYLLYSSLAYNGLWALVGVAVVAAGALLLPSLGSEVLKEADI